MEEDSKLQGGLKWVLAAGGVGVTAPFFLGLDRTTTVTIVLVIVALLIVLVGGYFLWTFWRKKRAREGFRKGTVDGPAGTIPGVDAKGLAELDAMRRKFQEGIQAYKSRGKDLYSLPWYLLVGESSAGKTEAVRHCGVGFPPGLTDQLQGVGGTINMHWWFTNQAVILDTAGKMLFSGIKPGESSLWQDFLKHLKKSRPHCPINGLVLVLPVNSLIKDSASKIGEKAAVIAKQIDLIQRTLDVRFPVFLLVTKCDLLTGFREYFDGMEDIEAMQQIFGWSNPEPLDAPFQPELVDQHLEIVAQRLRRRRLAMLRDPAERGPGKATRLEAVDSLFALPQSLLLIAPRLKRYLQTIFVAGEWAPKPVFLRGIYFSSSLQQGSPLDEALATLRGVSIEDMREEIEGAQTGKTFFLYDLFTEKIFKERGLVTRATNTLSMLRRRRWALLGTGAAILLGWAGLSLYGVSKLKHSVGQEAGDWQRAETNWTADGAWANRIVDQPSPGKPYVYKGDEPMGSRSATWTDYYVRLHEKAENPPPVPWMFKPAALALPTIDRKPARNVVFAHAVLKPLLQSTRSAMSAGSGQPVSDPEEVRRHNKALNMLIDVERDLIGSRDSGGRSLRTNAAALYLKTMISYLTATSPPNSVSNLAPVFATIYTEQNGVVPGWDSGGGSLKENKAINSGLDQFFTNSSSGLADLETRRLLLEGIRDAARKFRTNEESLHKSGFGGSSEWLELISARNELDQVLAKAAKATNLDLVLGSDRLLQTNYVTLTNRAMELAADAVKLAVQAGEAPIFAEIDKRVADARKGIAEPFIKSYEASAKDMSLLDEGVLAPSGTNRQYAVRAELYQRSRNFSGSNFFSAESIGQKWVGFHQIASNANSLKREIERYSGAYAAEVTNLCGKFLDDATRRHEMAWVEGYIKLATQGLAELRGMPAGKIDLGFLRTNRYFVAWEQDLSADNRPPDTLDQQLTTVRDELKNTRLSLIQKFANYQNAELKRMVGFPVVWDAKTDLTYQDIKTLKGYCDQIGVGTARLTNEFSYPSQPLQPLVSNLTRVAAILGNLAGSASKPPRVVVSIDAGKNLSNAELGLTHSYKYVCAHFKGDGEFNGIYVGSSAAGPIPIGEGDLSQRPLVIEMRESKTNDTTALKLSENNGALGLLHRFTFLRKADEKLEFGLSPGTWKLRVKMRDKTQNLVTEYVELMVTIGDGATKWPSRDEWPKLSDIQ